MIETGGIGKLMFQGIAQHRGQQKVTQQGKDNVSTNSIRIIRHQYEKKNRLNINPILRKNEPKADYRSKYKNFKAKYRKDFFPLAG